MRYVLIILLLLQVSCKVKEGLTAHSETNLIRPRRVDSTGFELDSGKKTSYILNNSKHTIERHTDRHFTHVIETPADTQKIINEFKATLPVKEEKSFLQEVKEFFNEILLLFAIIFFIWNFKTIVGLFKQRLG